MKILLVNKFHFIKGGSERYYFDLAENLKAHGHEVIFFAMKHEKNIPCEQEKYFTDFVQTEKITFNLAGLKSVFKLWWNFEAAKKINQLIQDEKPNLVHLHNISHQISPSILRVIKKYKLPTVMTMHDYKLVCPNGKMFTHGKVCEKCQGQNYFNCLKNKCVKNSFLASLATFKEMFLHHKILKIYEKNIDLFMAPSEFLKNKMISWGWPKEKIIHLPYFINSILSSRVEADVKSAETEGSKDSSTPFAPLIPVGMTKEKKNYILYFGRLSKEKGIDTLIEAMRDLPGIKLKIVGTGPEKENYELRIMNYGLKNIETLGYKSGQELNEIIANAKFIVVPSVWYENYPMSVLESYALGVPALVANIGGLPEMIPNQDKNFIFESGNIKELGEKINFLWQNNSIVSEAGERVKNFVKKNNNPEKHYQKMTTFMLSSSRKRGSQHLQLSTES